MSSDLAQLGLRFLIGGAVVSFFAVLGEIFRPKSFAGLFGAAPSIALATLGLTIAHDGKAYAAIEARSMIFGAIAFFCYAAQPAGCSCASRRARSPQPLRYCPSGWAFRLVSPTCCQDSVQSKLQSRNSIWKKF
jgi:hypothetical protein